MAKRFFLQIVDDAGNPATIPLGGKIERDLFLEMEREMASRGVRFRTQTHILRDMRDSLAAVLSGMRKEVKSIA